MTKDKVHEHYLVISYEARFDQYDISYTYTDVPLLVFTNHKYTPGLKRENEAGFYQVVAKSALDERAPELIDGLIASPP